MIKGIIFDFDGLIFDTETPQYEILNDIFIEHGSKLPLSRWQQEIGTQSGFSPFKYLKEQVDQELNKDDLKEKFRTKFQERITKAQARQGVEEYLSTAKELQLKIGLATSSTYEWAANHLKNLDLFHYFQCIKTSDDVEHVKPDPTLYLEAAKCLGLKTEECLVFEDSANGALAAKKAGMKCVIVPNPVTEAMNFCEVEHRINSMSDINLEELIELISTQNQ